MSYIDRFLARLSDMSPRGTDRTDKTPAQRTRQSSGDELTRPTRTSPVSPVSGPGEEPSNLTTAWPPRPTELADWPIPRRQRWGELANAFEDQGVPFPESERRAFEASQSREDHAHVTDQSSSIGAPSEPIVCRCMH